MMNSILSGSSIVIFTGCILYAGLLYRWPRYWLPVILAALPVLDFAPWTGQFFFDEYDLLLLLTVGTVLMRRGWPVIASGSVCWSATSRNLFVGLGVSCLLSTVLGAWPFPAPDLNSFNTYLSPYNALRVAKGMGFAGLLLLLIARDFQTDPNRTIHQLVLGISLGVIGASAAVIWERLNFTGLFNFDSGYRVVGLFSGMHTGGAYVEGYFVTALPFVIFWGIISRSWWLKLCALLVFIIGGYALLVTYARGGYLAFVLSCLVLFCGLLWRKNLWRKNNGHGKVPALAALLALILVSGGLLFSWSATPMHERFNQLSPDSRLRVSHWQQILSLIEPGWRVKLFGEGLGRLPAMFARQVNTASGNQLSEYHFATQQGKTFLQLSGGDPVYFEQIVTTRLDGKYSLNVVARNRMLASELYVSICQKWMLYANRCQWYRISLPASAQWQSYRFDVDANDFMSMHRYFQPLIKLSLANYQDGSVAEVASVALLDQGRNNLIANGDFSNGSQFWFFSTDNHLPWHYKNLFLQIYFEQGLLGLSLFLALLMNSAKLLFVSWKEGQDKEGQDKEGREKDVLAPLLAASLCGFLVVGLVDSLFDFPRMSMLFYLLLMLAQFQHKPINWSAPT